jgi:hypothetical protein
LDRIADLAKDGWFSGDLHVHRPLKEMPLLMQARDVHVAPVITWWNKATEWRGRDIPGKLLHSLEGQRFSRTSTDTVASLPGQQAKNPCCIRRYNRSCPPRLLARACCSALAQV